MVCAGDELADGRYGSQNKVETLKYLLVLATEVCVALAKKLNFFRGNRGTPLQASGDDGIECVIEACM